MEKQALHRDWFLHRLATVEADWYGPHQARWLALTRRELPNIRAALEFCINNGDAARAATLLMTAWRVVWQAHGRTDELGRWCARVVELESSGTPDICQAMTMLGGLEVARGDEDIGRRRLGLAGELAEQLGDDFSRAFVCAMRGSVAVDAEQSLALMEESLALQGGTNLIPARANVEERIAALHDRLGHADSAAPLREALIARAIGAGDSFETEYLLHNTGWSAATRGDVSSATMLLRQSLSLMQNLENPVGVAQVEELLASVAADSQDYARAALLIGIADTIGGAAGAVASAFPLDAWLRGDTMDRARRMLGSRAYDVAFANGKSMSFDVGVAYALGAQLPSRPGTKVRAGTRDLLTARESQVAALVGQGLTDREIADRLVISKRTAEGHVANSLTKLGFTSRTQLASWTARDPSTDPSQ